jgi:hypothetical protein
MIGLLDLSHFYLEEKLKQKWIDMIVNELTVEKVCAYYLSALKYESQKLQDICIEFAIDNIYDVCITKSFRQIDERRNTILALSASRVETISIDRSDRVLQKL